MSVDAPEYPEVCSTREAMVPMWTADTTETEIAEYEAAKNQYESDMAAYNAAVAAASESLDSAAETANVYAQFFSDQKIYVDSNATAQAYEFLKTLPTFDGVSDV
ncbi:hypothetical protein [uncultured Desulfobacter sp.]|uniref:hypothetical protein n=1 Tax=uncultured Desulfobacter sp. TaxID=240139 RepID=UPI0029F4BD28|nr:hypothetical protein [uncultured Desulfobacter sp.]